MDNLSLLHSYAMKQPYWEIEEYEPEDLSEYDVTVDSTGVPAYINTGDRVIDSLCRRRGIYVLTTAYELRMGCELHHSDLTHGEPVLCAGEFKLAKNGAIRELNNKSGHFAPSASCIDDVLDVIEDAGYDIRKIKINNYG